MGFFMKKVSEILSRYFDTHGIQEGDTYADFFASWREIAGPGLCDHTQVVDIKNGIAIVHVDHPGWMQKLTFKKQSILVRLQQRYPELEITNVLMKCVPTEQLGKPSVEFQREQLTKQMEQKRREQREAYENHLKDQGKQDKAEPLSTDQKKPDDPEFLSLLKRIEKLSE
jgi:hypothetical protein